MRLEKKVAMITGGYGGMGRASARLFAKEGATVFIAGRSEAPVNRYLSWIELMPWRDGHHAGELQPLSG
jgi:NAD(P)-dependent dehydrogenase (short-subunit alcohol dehydrogenase family)